MFKVLPTSPAQGEGFLTGEIVLLVSDMLMGKFCCSTQHNHVRPGSDIKQTLIYTEKTSMVSEQE